MGRCGWGHGAERSEEVAKKEGFNKDKSAGKVEERGEREMGKLGGRKVGGRWKVWKGEEEGLYREGAVRALTAESRPDVTVK